MSGKKSLGKGILAGVAGGLVASWIMNEFMAGPGVALQHAVQTDAENATAADQARQAEQSAEPKIDATMKTADALVNAVTGEHLTLAEQQKGGPVVHYAFGAIMGGLYGGLAEYLPAVKAGFGTTFGSALFTGADLIAVPLFHLSGAPTDSPASAYATPLAAHLVYGASTELVRRVARKLF